MLNTVFRRLAGVVGFVYLALSAIVAFAQDELDEIVVTADLLGRAASELPASVAVLDAQEIDEAAIQHFEELMLSVPNLNWSGEGNRARYLQIRGVGELEQYEGAPNPSVGFLIDDIDFSGIGGIATLFDMQRIEVLRGPQGTRYGANALAGLVYAQSAEPERVWSGRATASAGGDDLVSGGVAFGGPIGGTQTAAFRASLHRHESDGFRSNPFLGRDDTNGRDETTARLKVSWEAGDDWSFRLAGLYVDVDDGYDAFALDNSLTVLSDQPGRDAQESLGASIRATGQLSNELEITSITSYARSDVDFSFDADWGNADSWAPYVYDYTSATQRQRTTLSQEIRLASGRGDVRRWLAGVYALQLDESFASNNQGVYVDNVTYNFSDALAERLDSDFEALNFALFGQYALPVGEVGELTAGLRLERRSADYADTNDLALAPDEDMLGAELAYTHSLNSRINAYTSLSRGYKAGGFNLGNTPAGRREFDGETLWNFEVGLKSNWADGQVSFNAAAFYNRREDQQVRVSAQLNPNDPASFVFFTDNAARGRTLGLEAELRWQSTDVLELYASLGLLDAEFERADELGEDLEGRDQAHAPNYSLTAGGALRFGNGVFARLDVNARDAFFFDVSHDQRSEASVLAHARLGIERERWAVQLWARNLFDEEYAVRGFFFGNEPPDFPAELYTRRGDPRQVGVRVDFFFQE